MYEKPIILCVDDERVVLEGLREELEREFAGEYAIEVTDSGEEALEVLRDLLAQGHEVPAVVSDHLMPGMNGDELFVEIHRIDASIRKILLTGQATASAIGKAVNEAGLYRYLPKPWDHGDLRLTVAEAVKSYYLSRQLSEQVKVLRDLHAHTKYMAEEINPTALGHHLLTTTIADTGAGFGWLRLFGPGGRFDLSAVSMTTGEVTVLSPEENPPAPSWALKEAARARKSFERTLEAAAERATLAEGFGLRPHPYVYCAPLLHQEQMLGALYLEYPRRLKATQMEFLDLMATHASVSLDDAYLYEALEDKVRERTQTIEEKNRDIFDSLHYARRIQLSILPPISYFKQYLKDSFILYWPKEIVSGDFYWFAAIDHYCFVAAVDCTGHGVPGAFMSVVGNNLLNQIVRENKVLDTHKILNELHQKVMQTMNWRQEEQEDDQTPDGMDISLCRLDAYNKTIQFSGANRPLYLYRKGKFHYYKPDRHSIGGSLYRQEPNYSFSQQMVPYQANDCLYLFTDGVADQFGGAYGRKFSYRRLQELLAAVHHVSMEEQYRIIKQDLMSWKENRPQVDDVLVMGIRL